MKPARVSCVITNCNGMEHLEACLSSLHNQTCPPQEIIVVDDCSTDGSTDFIRQRFPNVQIVRHEKNQGFVRTANDGMRAAAGEWVLLLNNDIECEPMFIEELVKTAERHPEAGILAPKILMFWHRKILNGVGCCLTHHWWGWDRGLCEKDEGQYDQPCEVAGACGGAMMIRKAVLKQVGYMDEGFNVFFDDVDLSHRARIAGWTIRTVPTAVLYHKFGAFFGIHTPCKQLWMERHRIRSFLKNCEWSTIYRLFPDIFRTDMWIAWRMRKGSYVASAYKVLAYLWNVWYLPSTLLARRKVQKTRVTSDDKLFGLIDEGSVSCRAAVSQFTLRDNPETCERIVMSQTNQKGLGYGWLDARPCAGAKGEYVRPTTKEAEFVLDTKGHSHVHVRMAGPSAPVIMQGEVILDCGGSKRFMLSRREPITVTIELPKGVERCRGLIKLNRTWRPIDYFHCPDTREHGVMVYQISAGDLRDTQLIFPTRKAPSTRNPKSPIRNAHITCLVINYNGKPHLDTCLTSILGQDYPAFDLVVQDDCSPDASATLARQIGTRQRRCKVSVRVNKKNLGFARTANTGVKNCGDSDWALLLNNDIEMAPGCLQALGEAIQKYPGVHIFATKMMLFSARSVINGVGNVMGLWGGGSDRGQFETDYGQYDEPCEVFGACGGAMLIHRRIWNALGGMDGRFLFLFDDVDLCWRARLMSERILTVPSAVIYHKLGASYGRRSKLKDFVIARNRLLMVLKNHSWARLRQVFPRMWKHTSKEARRWHILHLPGTLLARWRIQRSRAMPFADVEKLMVKCPGVPALCVDYPVVDDTNKSDAVLMGATDSGRLGPGWSEVKTDGASRQAYRRTSRESVMYFALNGARRPRILLLKIKGGALPRITGKIDVSGHMQEFDVRKDQFKLLKVPFEADGLTKITIKCNETWPVNKCRLQWGIHVYWAEVIEG